MELDIAKHCVKINGKDVPFARKEFDLLKLLISTPGKVFTRGNILEQVWGTDIYVGDRTIDVHINRLRDKIYQDYIKTIKGIGYKLTD